MPAQSYMQRVNGAWRRAFGVVTGGTVAQAGALVALDDNGLADPSIFPSTIAKADTRDGTATGAIPARSLVYFPGDGTMVLATAAAGSAHEAQGYVLTAVANGATGRAYLNAGIIPGFTGLTPGARYWLSETAGGVTPTPVTGTGGKIDQLIGWALSTTELEYDPEAQGVLLP